MAIKRPYPDLLNPALVNARKTGQAGARPGGPVGNSVTGPAAQRAKPLAMSNPAGRSTGVSPGVAPGTSRAAGGESATSRSPLIPIIPAITAIGGWLGIEGQKKTAQAAAQADANAREAGGLPSWAQGLGQQLSATAQASVPGYMPPALSYLDARNQGMAGAYPWHSAIGTLVPGQSNWQDAIFSALRNNQDFGRTRANEFYSPEGYGQASDALTAPLSGQSEGASALTRMLQSASTGANQSSQILRGANTGGVNAAADRLAGLQADPTLGAAEQAAGGIDPATLSGIIARLQGMGGSGGVASNPANDAFLSSVVGRGGTASPEAGRLDLAQSMLDPAAMQQWADAFRTQEQTTYEQSRDPYRAAQRRAGMNTSMGKAAELDDERASEHAQRVETTIADRLANQRMQSAQLMGDLATRGAGIESERVGTGMSAAGQMYGQGSSDLERQLAAMQTELGARTGQAGLSQNLADTLTRIGGERFGQTSTAAGLGMTGRTGELSATTNLADAMLRPASFTTGALGSTVGAAGNVSGVDLSRISSQGDLSLRGGSLASTLGQDERDRANWLYAMSQAEQQPQREAMQASQGEYYTGAQMPRSDLSSMANVVAAMRGGPQGAAPVVPDWRTNAGQYLNPLLNYYMAQDIMKRT